MCGINGIAFSSRSGRTVSPVLLKAMRDVITHRGPDDAGIFMEMPMGFRTSQNSGLAAGDFDNNGLADLGYMRYAGGMGVAMVIDVP